MKYISVDTLFQLNQKALKLLNGFKKLEVLVLQVNNKLVAGFQFYRQLTLFGATPL
jgi:hypothetical protein